MSKKPPKQSSISRDVDFLFEIGTLRFIHRTWVQFLSPHFANLAEHHFQVMWLALTLAQYEPAADTGKIAKMALVHDIAESRAGDVHYISRQYVKRDEQLGIHDMLQETSLEQEMLALWEEYEKRQSLESKIVKDADNLNVDMELREQTAMGNQVAEAFKKTRKIVSENQLFTTAARQFWKQIQETDPHAWHMKGRNRVNSGDWQVKK